MVHERLLLIVTVVTMTVGCSPALNVLDADLTHGVPQTRPVPPQSYALSPSSVKTKTIVPASKDLYALPPPERVSLNGR